MDDKLKKSYVTRSVYQKLAEENKKLLKDISVLVQERYLLSEERVFIIMKWRKRFDMDKQLTDMLKEIAIEHFKNNPHEHL